MSSEYADIASRSHRAIGLREIHGRAMRRDELGDLLGQHPLEDWLQTIGKTSKVQSDAIPGNPTMDLHLAGYLGPLARPARSKISAGGRFVSPQALNTLAREAFLVSPEREPEGWDDRNLRDFARALLGVIDIFEDPRPMNLSDRAEVNDAIVSLLLRRIARPPAHLRNTVPRIHRIFIDLPHQQPELAKDFDFDATCRALCGIGLERYLAICFTFFVRFDQAKAPNHWVLSSDYYGPTTVSTDEFLRAVRSVSATSAELQKSYQNELAAGFAGIDDHRPIVQRPICEIRPGAFIPIDMDSLAERLVGDGIFWRLRPHGTAKGHYGATVGKFLEEHLYEVARDVYVKKGRADRLYREKRYQKRELGPDLVVVDDGALMLCEIGANIVNVRDTLHRGSLDAFASDIERILIPRIAQLDRKINDIRRSTLTYDPPFSTTMRIEPVVCLLDGFPLAPIIRERIDAAIARVGLLKQSDVGRVSILSAEDFELACGMVERHGYAITEMLRGHAESTSRDWPLREYIRSLVGEFPMTNLIEREFVRVTAGITRAIAADGALVT